MPSTIKVLNQNVLIHPIEAPDKIGRINIPETSRRRVNQGIIVALGRNVESLEVGDHVMFSGYTGDKITIADGGIFHVAHESHIDCVLVDSDVVLMSTEQVKEIIRRRFGELKQERNSWGQAYMEQHLEKIEQSLLDRIDTWTIAEGMEF